MLARAIAAVSGAASAFLGLTDSPSSYSGQGGKVVKVNAGETALIFDNTGDIDGGSFTEVYTFTNNFDGGAFV